MKFLLINESVLLLPCAGEVGVDGDALLELADNVCGLADVDARKSAVRVEHESECAALIVDLGADRLKRSEGILRQRERVSKQEPWCLGTYVSPSPLSVTRVMLTFQPLPCLTQEADLTPAGSTL